MNREILFRGYNLKNKKWLYGYYFVNRGQHFISPDEIVNPLATPEDYLVDESTVSQYTGLNDYKGNKIFEGDIIALESRDNVGLILFNHDEAKYVSIIKYDYCTKPKKMWEHYGFKTTNSRLKEFGYVVIGNIYENEEIMSNTEIDNK